MSVSLSDVCLRTYNLQHFLAMPATSPGWQAQSNRRISARPQYLPSKPKRKLLVWWVPYHPTHCGSTIFWPSHPFKANVLFQQVPGAVKSTAKSFKRSIRILPVPIRASVSLRWLLYYKYEERWETTAQTCVFRVPSTDHLTRQRPVHPTQNPTADAGFPYDPAGLPCKGEK
jgi:hypothetical protein